MKKWQRYIRNAIGTGLTWAAGWAVISVLTGIITELLSGYSLETHVDPLAAMAMPGFIFGVIFSTVLWFAEPSRNFYDLSLSRLAAWGAVIGFMAGLLPFVLGTPTDGFPLWLEVVTLVGPLALLNVVSAVGTALLFRYFVRHNIGFKAGR